MNITTATIWQSLAAKAREQVLRTVRRRYFPEVWYAVENWLQTVRVRQVLEVGYGIGLVGEALAKSGWNVTTVDPSQAALNELSERYAKHQLSGTFVCADLSKLPFESQSQEAVIAINSLDFCADPRQVLKEIQRVLKPSGRALIVGLNRYGPWALPLVAQQLRHTPSRSPPHLLGRDEFMALLTNARLPPAQILDRANYLPIILPVRVKLPVAGAFVALIKNHLGGYRRSSKPGRPSKQRRLGQTKSPKRPGPSPSQRGDA